MSNCQLSPRSNQSLDGLKSMIYMDNQSTTRMDDRVIEAIIEQFKNNYGNPHSRTHGFGWAAEDCLEVARSQIAKVINAEPSEIFFTSGATESNNAIIKGVGEFYKNDKKDHIISVSTEHKCVIESCRYLQSRGFNVTFIKPEKDGLIDLDKLKDAITDRTILVSIMAVNNEIGVIQDMHAIGQICRDKGVFFHTDAAQAFGKIKIDVESMNIDLMSISAHKIYGPKGIGAMYIRRKPRVRIIPLIVGGGQERGMRSGTMPTPLAVGFGVAAEISQLDFEKDANHIEKLSDKLYSKVMEIPHVYLNGSKEKRYKGNLNFSFAFIEGEALMMAMRNVALSSGSACTSSSLEPSYVLRSIGIADDLSHSAIRFGIGRFTTETEIDEIVQKLLSAVSRLREISPLWEMHQKGIDISKIKWDNNH